MRRKAGVTVEDRDRWSSRKKMDVVLRLLKGATAHFAQRRGKVNPAMVDQLAPGWADRARSTGCPHPSRSEAVDSKWVRKRAPRRL
jgi:hypothetical protein